MKRKLCEPLEGRIAGTKVLTEAEIVARGYPKREGILGYVDGIFSVCNKENKNHRIYEHALWEEVHRSDRFMGMLESLTLLGEPDHPETRTQSSITEGSHTIVDQFIEGDYVKGTVAVFDNPKAHTFWPMLKAGVKLGFSTRGDGDLVEDSRTGKTKVDPKSYEYHGVDFVLNPSFVEAGPTAITEEAWTGMRRALTEAVEESHAGEETSRNVRAILEAIKPESMRARLVEDAKTSANEGAIASLVGQLTEAKNQVAELRESLDKSRTLEQNTRKQCEKELGALRAQVEAKDDTLAEAETRNKILEKQLARARGNLNQLSEKTKGKVDAAQVTQLKRVLQENQNSHLSLVTAHKALQGAHKKLQAKYDEGLKVLGELRERLAEADKRTAEAERLAEQAKKDSSAAREELEANKQSIPNLISDSTLDRYKAIRTEGVDVPVEFQRLMERAESEAEVDAVLEAIAAKQTSRYSFLPGGPNSRSLREAIAESIPDEGRSGGNATTEDNEADAEAEQLKEVTIRQLGGRRKKG